MMNITTLHYFFVTAQHLNFSRAARHLYITQPALSKQIQQLEDQLKIRLFDRTKRSVKLTEAGALLFDQCRRLFQTMSDLETAMENFRKEIRGSLRIAATPALGNCLLPDFVKNFSMAYPQVMLHTLLITADDMIEQIKKGELDFGLMTSDQPIDGLAKISMQGERLVFVCSRNCENQCSIREKSLVKPKELEECRFIALSKQTLIRRAIDDYFGKLGVHLKILIESENIEIIKSMVIRGMGGSIVPECAVRREIAENLLMVRRIEGVNLSQPVCLYYRQEAQVMKIHEEFINTLSQFCHVAESDPPDSSEPHPS